LLAGATLTQPSANDTSGGRVTADCRRLRVVEQHGFRLHDHRRLGLAFMANHLAGRVRRNPDSSGQHPHPDTM